MREPEGRALRINAGPIATIEMTGTAAPPSPLRMGSAVWPALSSFLRRKPLGAIGAVVLLVFVGLAILAPALATHDPDLNDHRTRVKPPSAQH